MEERRATHLNACKKCWEKYHNPGCLTVFSATESDCGGWYPAHVRCNQCGTNGPGMRSAAESIAEWNKVNPKSAQDAFLMIPLYVLAYSPDATEIFT